MGDQPLRSYTKGQQDPYGSPSNKVPDLKSKPKTYNALIFLFTAAPITGNLALPKRQLSSSTSTDTKHYHPMHWTPWDRRPLRDPYIEIMLSTHATHRNTLRIPQITMTKYQSSSRYQRLEQKPMT